MLRKDVEWYIDNLEKISEFEKWIEVVKADLPRQLATLVKRAANTAVTELDAKSDFGYELFSEANRDGTEIYWFQSGSYDAENDVGAIATAFVPTNIQWLTSESDDPPLLEFLYSQTKRKQESAGKEISKAVRKLPTNAKRTDKTERYGFVCVRRVLTELLSAAALRDPVKLEANLTELFREFTEAMMPGFERARALTENRPVKVAVARCARRS